jgi:hypothetical protein
MKTSIFKKWWFWVIIVIVIAAIAFSGGSDSGKQTAADSDAGEVVQEESGNEQGSDEPDEPDVPKEYESALKKAETYSDMMHMSKAGIYDQLTSEYGEQFSEEAAQYAMENLDADYKANALAKAESYQDTMNMSPDAIYDQLISEYGEQFTPEEAQYAIDNLSK